MMKRHAAGLTVRDIAEEFGTSKSTVARLVKKKREGAVKKLFSDTETDGEEGNL